MHKGTPQHGIPCAVQRAVHCCAVQRNTRVHYCSTALQKTSAEVCCCCALNSTPLRAGWKNLFVCFSGGVWICTPPNTATRGPPHKHDRVPAPALECDAVTTVVLYSFLCSAVLLSLASWGHTKDSHPTPGRRASAAHTQSHMVVLYCYHCSAVLRSL